MAKIIKGEKRGRPGKWLVDWRDHAGIRRIKTFDTKVAAEDFFARVALPAGHHERTGLQADRKTTQQTCFDRWLNICKTGGIKQRSLDIYQEQWTRYCGEVAALEARNMSRHRAEGLLLRLSERVGPATLKLVYRVLYGTCGEAVELGLLATNPVAGLLKRLRLNRKSSKDGQDIKAMTREQAAKFLAAVLPKFFAIFHSLIETGLRLGELLALEWADVNLDARTLTVSKTMTCQDKAIGKTNTNTTRTVDLSADVVVTLKTHALASGRREGFVFAPDTLSRRTVRHRIENEMFNALQRAGLPVHHTPHSCRHTY